MENWKTVRLGDVCEQIRGVSYKPADLHNELDDNSVILLRANNIFGDALNYDELVYVDNKKVSDSQYLKKGDILICASSGSKNLVGKAACLEEDRKLTFGAFCKVLRTDSVNHGFFKHYFFSPSYRSTISSLSAGANINNIRAEDLDNLLIPLPPLEEQKQIAEQLDKCTALIAKHKQMLEKFDILIKSRFIEMFGDPVKNPMGWENKFGKELFSFSSGKFLDASKRMEKGIPVYGGNGIAWYTDIPLISFDTIIIGRVGAYCGNIKKVQEPVWVTDNAIYIKQFKEKCFNLNFLYELMSYMNFYQYADFSGQPKITQKPLENNKYIIPPIEKQKQFAAFVQQIDKSKFEYTYTGVAA